MTRGYKETEVGVIPNDWKISRLVDLIDPSRSVRYGIVQPGKFDPNGRYMVRGQDYSKGWAQPEELFRVSPQVEEPFQNARVKAGDVIITIVGAGTGHVEMIPSWLDGANLTQTTARLAINTSKADSEYCKFVLQSWLGKRQVASYVKGAAQPGLNCGDIEKFIIPLPSKITEQHAIAEALSEVDALIGALDQLIAKKSDLKQAAMQQLLTSQTRLPGYAAKWTATTLRNIARIQRGASPRPIEDPIWFDENSSIGWVRISDVTQTGMFLRETTQRLSELGVAHSRPVAKGSLIMSICATVGRPVITEIDVCIHDGFVVFNNLKADQRYVYYVLKGIEPDWSKHGQTGSQMNLNTALINSTSINLPPRDEQTAIAEVLSDMDAELTTLEQRRDKTRSLKQGMMQQLLTGQIRLV